MPQERLAGVRFGAKVQLLHSTLYGVARSISTVTTGSAAVSEH